MKRAMLLLLLLAIAAPGCAGRDYKSANRQSRQFFWEGTKGGGKRRKESLRFLFGSASERRKNERDSRKFFWNTIFEDQWKNWRETVRDFRQGIRDDARDVRASVRFGFLDSD